jgi:hypothetical protein
MFSSTRMPNPEWVHNRTSARKYINMLRNLAQTSQAGWIAERFNAEAARYEAWVNREGPRPW